VTSRAASIAGPDEGNGRSLPPLEFRTFLKEVSRSFFLTLQILPGKVRQQIGLAYLLARASDTIADTEALPVEIRLDALAALRDRIIAGPGVPLNLDNFINRPSLEASGARVASDAEQRLLLRIEDVLRLLTELSSEDLASVRSVLSTIISGQELDLQRFGGNALPDIVALNTRQELDDYTYRVAGCVGEFWTRICRRHLFPDDRIDDALMLDRAIQFGKGLQLVNILRDLPADLRAGRCYLPSESLREQGLAPVDLLDSANYNRLQPLYCELLNQAEAHLQAGWAYTNMLPRRCCRIRLGCAWPILIGVRTIAKLRGSNILGAATPIKISRHEVRQIIRRSLLGQLWPPLWQRLFGQCKVV
jgi:farnesyl-diphosphate farnesyltransferase